MNYIVISNEVDGTSAERAENINRELYKISRPANDPNDGTLYMFGTYEDGLGNVAIGYEDTDKIPVHELADVTPLKQTLIYSASETELNNLEAYLLSKKGSFIYFKDIIPSSIIIRDYAYMVANGFITE